MLKTTKMRENERLVSAIVGPAEPLGSASRCWHEPQRGRVRPALAPSPRRRHPLLPTSHRATHLARRSSGSPPVPPSLHIVPSCRLVLGHLVVGGAGVDLRARAQRSEKPPSEAWGRRRGASAETSVLMGQSRLARREVVCEYQFENKRRGKADARGATGRMSRMWVLGGLEPAAGGCGTARPAGLAGDHGRLSFARGSSHQVRLSP
jgi:hypothetical protein